MLNKLGLPQTHTRKIDNSRFLHNVKNQVPILSIQIKINLF